jgi:spermidine synthase
MDESKKSVSCATVFFSSGYIMALELVAGRLIARHLGTSLYTWTTVIGVMLMGISIGSYLGGRIADFMPAKKILAAIFGICSVVCISIVIQNNLIPNWVWLWRLNWPLHVFLNVFFLFAIPSTILGMIFPVATKIALDRGSQTGRIIGNIYAWSAAGSFSGLFIVGFFLIDAVGTVTIIWIIAASTLFMAVLFWPRPIMLYLSVLFIALITVVVAPAKWTGKISEALALKEVKNSSVIYQDETQYCFISVKRILKRPDMRVFIQDKLVHSMAVMEDINNLQYPYTRIYAGITTALSENKKTLYTMIIGGGGYVYPSYLEKNLPQSHIDVIEIDPGVTKAAVRAFALQSSTRINNMIMDARDYVNELLHKQLSGSKIPQYDFIYEDALNDYSPPYQLLTKEFNDKIYQILADDGVYMLVAIDIFDTGKFVGAVFNTLQKTFPNVYILSQALPHNMRNTFVLVASKQRIDIHRFIEQYSGDIDIWLLNDTEMDTLKKKACNIVLTDDYAPVENLLTPVVCQSAPDVFLEKFGIPLEKTGN